MKHLVMVGACYLDTILTVPHFPEEDAKLRATSLETRRGGNCGNALEVLQQFEPELALHLVAILPGRGSAAAAQIRSSFGSQSKVNLSHSIYREDQAEAASCYIIRSLATGSRTIVNHNSLTEMTVGEFVTIADAFRDKETWWHFEGRVSETTLKCIRYLRQQSPQTHVSVEVEKPGREGLRELAREADVVFYSRAWAEGEGYATAEALLTGEVAPKTSLLLCTWGARGAYAISPPSREVLHINPASDTDVQIVDAIGAGDTFTAGILYGRLCRTREWNVEKTVKFAVDLATAKVQQDGFERLASKVAAAFGQG